MGQGVVVWSHETTLAAEAASASRARDFVCLHLCEHRLLYLVEDVRLVASELATNAVTSDSSPFTLVLQGLEHSVVLTVSDGSRCAPVTGRPDPYGRGLAVVEAVSQDWGVTQGPGGTTSVWASFEVRSREPAHPGGDLPGLPSTRSL